MPSTSSTVSYPGDGTTTTFSVPFDYIQEKFISVTVDLLPVPFTFISAGTIQITPAPAADTEIRITRSTTMSRLVDYADGSVLLSRTLNLGETQLLHLIQELNDRRSGGGDEEDLEEVLAALALLGERVNQIRQSPTLPSVVDLRSFNFFGAAPESILTLGHSAPGDGGGWTWVRVPSATSYAVHEQSADGLYWTPQRAVEFPAAALGFGVGTPTGASNVSAFRRGMRLLNAWGGGKFVIGAGVHPMAQTVQQGLAALTGITISGAGRKATVLQRSTGETTGSYIVFRDCSGVRVEDLTVDGRETDFPGSAHALHFAECVGWSVQRVHLTGFDASALSVISTEGGTAYVNRNFQIRDVSVDGLAQGRNGILVTNASDFSISGITGGNLDLSGETGAPSVGIGIKTNCIRGTVSDCTLNLVRRGVNLGAEGNVSQCRAWGIYIYNAVSGIGLIEAADCHFSDVTLRTPYDEPDIPGNAGFAGGQITMRDASRCTVTNVTIRGRGNAYPILHQQRTENCRISIGLWDNSPGDTSLMTALEAVTALRLDVEQYQGPGVASPATLLTLSAGTTGLRYYWRGDRVLPA